jgi:hypothetical protein
MHVYGVLPHQRPCASCKCQFSNFIFLTLDPELPAGPVHYRHSHCTRAVLTPPRYKTPVTCLSNTLIACSRTEAGVRHYPVKGNSHPKSLLQKESITTALTLKVQGCLWKLTPNRSIWGSCSIPGSCQTALLSETASSCRIAS